MRWCLLDKRWTREIELYSKRSTGRATVSARDESGLAGVKRGSPTKYVHQTLNLRPKKEDRKTKANEEVTVVGSTEPDLSGEKWYEQKGEQLADRGRASTSMSWSKGDDQSPRPTQPSSAAITTSRASGGGQARLCQQRLPWHRPPDDRRSTVNHNANSPGFGFDSGLDQYIYSYWFGESPEG